jgi:ABC-2 type transport system ATP-binding protein
MALCMVTQDRARELAHWIRSTETFVKKGSPMALVNNRWSRTTGHVQASSGIMVEGVQKQFGRVKALDTIGLVVHPHEIVAILGPNGAGKSTLLRVLSTLVLPDAGRAVVAGSNVATDPRGVQRKIGVSFGEDRAWYWRLTGRQNLEFFSTLYGLDRAETNSRITALLQDFSLSDAADRRFSGYSSGMKARFSLMRALLSSPQVLLLDEPTRSLDPLAAHEFRMHVRRQRDNEDMAVLLTTHDMHEASVVADRILVLVKGRIVANVDHGPSAEELQRLLIETVKVWS